MQGNERFFVTLAFMLLPFPLYFFEMVRFRVFSNYLERIADSHPYPRLVEIYRVSHPIMHSGFSAKF